jgi:alpha-glucosidase
VLGNHDEPRLVARYGPENARAASVLLLTLRGQPTLYYGDELALSETDVPLEAQKDPKGLGVPGMGRDGCRVPMPWTPGPGHGFTESDVPPWLPFSEDADTRNVQMQLGNEDSMLNFVRQLLALRRRRPSLHRGTMRFIDGLPDDVLGYVRRFDGEETVALINFADTAQTIAVSMAGAVLASTHDASLLTEGSLDLAPHAAVVIDPGPDA